MGVETRYSARWDGPTIIERDAAQTVAVDLERGGSDASIASATFSLYDPSGSVKVDAQTATISGGEVSYAIGSTVLQSEAYGSGWLVKFDVVISSQTHSFYNDAALCLARVYPPIGHTDLVARHHDIANLLPSGVTSTQGYIDGAWATLTGRMYSEGVPFWRLRTMSALRDPLILLSLSYAFRDFSTLLDPADRYDELSTRYADQFERAFMQIRSRIDNSEDNAVTGTSNPTSAVIMLSSGRRSGRG